MTTWSARERRSGWQVGITRSASFGDQADEDDRAEDDEQQRYERQVHHRRQESKRRIGGRAKASKTLRDL